MTASTRSAASPRAPPDLRGAWPSRACRSMGLPPSGGFSAKWMLLTASLDTGQWWWAVVILAGGLMAAGYVFRLVDRALAAGDGLAKPRREGTTLREVVAVALALGAIGLGFLPIEPNAYLQIGRSGIPEVATR